MTFTGSDPIGFAAIESLRLRTDNFNLRFMLIEQMRNNDLLRVELSQYRQAIERAAKELNVEPCRLFEGISENQTPNHHAI
jgi:hypothetical protein